MLEIAWFTINMILSVFYVTHFFLFLIGHEPHGVVVGCSMALASIFHLCISFYQFKGDKQHD